MSKPTPGPWSWDESRETVYVVEDDDHVTTIVYGNVDPDDPAEGRANLRLIAQAPEMLAELEKQIHWLAHIRPYFTSYALPESVILGLDQGVKAMTKIVTDAKGRS